MRTLLIKYKPVLRFIGLFLGTYLVLSVFYGIYLKFSEGTSYPPDIITHLVAKQSSDLINNLGYTARVVPDPTDPTMQLFVEDEFLARIIEGCNAVSIIILFIAFIIAFAETIKKTVLFIFAGSVLIYAVNILRIVILAITLYEFPEQKELLHGVVFPGLIYGMVFILWMIWIRMLKIGKADE